MKAFGPLILALVICACSGSPARDDRVRPTEQGTLLDLISWNQSQAAQLSLGMSKADVIVVMGSKTAKTRDGTIGNPWLAEAMVGNDGVRYELLYYVTRKNQPFTPIRKSLTTRIVIKDGKVVAWGAGSVPFIGGTPSRQN